jgi:ABC-type dipeptide/oligopeptide/nickel transport system permease subunit
VEKIPDKLGHRRPGDISGRRRSDAQKASLSFLGGGDPNVASLGQTLTNGLGSAKTAWWLPAFLLAAIFTLVALLIVPGYN